MLVVGLTGSIAMGKSTVARMFASFGAPVFDADAAVRDLYAGPLAQAVEALFSGVVGQKGVDRNRLAERVLGDKDALRRLEALVHPEVAKARLGFFERSRSAGRRLVVVDVPLLFETGGERSVDLVVVVSADLAQQRARALERPGMTGDKLLSILAKQTPDEEKRQRAHAVIDTNCVLDETLAQVRQFLRAVAATAGGKMGHA